MRILKRNYQNQKIYGLKAKVYLNVLVILILLIPVVVVGRAFRQQELKTELYASKAYAQEKVIKKLQTPRSYTDIELNQIENYIRKVFGKNGNMAVAVAKGECRGLNPNCKFVTKQEHSVCQFQINLRAHYAKVPGQNMEEKETWLMNAQNCTLMAYQIYQTSGWWPWTSYTSGNYKKYL